MTPISPITHEATSCGWGASERTGLIVLVVLLVAAVAALVFIPRPAPPPADDDDPFTFP